MNNVKVIIGTETDGSGYFAHVLKLNDIEMTFDAMDVDLDNEKIKSLSLYYGGNEIVKFSNEETIKDILNVFVTAELNKVIKDLI